MRKIIFRNFQSPGDILMLTAAVRDLHRCYPNDFITDVRTSCPALWEHNPYLTTLREDDPDVEILDCHYPLIHESNKAPWHFLHGFIEYFNEQFGLRIRPTEIRGHVPLSADERRWVSQVHEILDSEVPFWIINAGGKTDFTIKWWDHRRFQAVVNHFRGRLLFVQIGSAEHYHPKLDGVLDLRGKTNLRQLVRLTHHSDGVVTPVSLMMHLAAAVDTKHRMFEQRPCVVIAGGREPPHWEAYPHHQFLHRNGTLRCCQHGGCWKSRTTALGDGSIQDAPDKLCVDVVDALPRCMDMIASSDVIRAIEVYLEGGAARELTATQVAIAGRFVQMHAEPTAPDANTIGV